MYFNLSLCLVSLFLYIFMSAFSVLCRMVDAAYHFLFVWYYCTLTIREHILKVNGSK